MSRFYITEHYTHGVRSRAIALLGQNHHIYDKVGNRKTKSEIVNDLTTVTGYDYDANDRLLNEKVNRTLCYFNPDCTLLVSLPPSNVMVI
ncbi:hypothetical protein LC653_42170 [Nostoc sp. CHAB 5784]|uniref:hypothetical protein n=1 Tax=Nostoc mirabile TaxID=2907820 RepID=UPI001E5D4821|nr:hypothetical protein [Nostoc mirabile]MCC5670226.1 hypothetical protein [Nostoc mirabile CHAB5784]